LNGDSPVTLSASTNISSDFTLGTYSLAKTTRVNFWKGLIDEVRIFNAARSKSQIQTDLKTYGPANATGLIAYYDFNEGSGTTIVNQTAGSESNSDLTITGSPTWNNTATTSSSGNRTVVTFERTYLNNSGGWATPPNVTSAQVLIVGGGGGGGDSNSIGGATGGGGGAT
jgi:hypothetical protein